MVLLRKKANISDLGSGAGGYLSSLQIKMIRVLVASYKSCAGSMDKVLSNHDHKMTMFHWSSCLYRFEVASFPGLDLEQENM